MNIFELFPITPGPDNGTQNLVNLAILAALFIGTLTLVVTVVVKVFQGLFWAKVNLQKKAGELKQNISENVPKKAEELKQNLNNRRRERLYAETLERLEIEESVLKARDHARNLGVPYDFAIKTSKNPKLLKQAKSALVNSDSEFAMLDMYEQFGKAIALIYQGELIRAQANTTDLAAINAQLAMKNARDEEVNRKLEGMIGGMRSSKDRKTESEE
jgi:hypothetical protein